MPVKNAILLAGGTGSRLKPFTHYMSKHLLNVAGQPIIDYPIHTLQKMGIVNLTIILGGDHFSQVVDHLQDGKRYGMNIAYLFQEKPAGIAQAVSICEKQVANDEQFVVILGDNIFEKDVVWNTTVGSDYAQIVMHNHPDLKRFGVASLDTKTHTIVKIEEKPKELDPQYHHEAIAGCYLFNQKFFEYFRDLKPSARNEFEITHIIERYLADDKLYFTQIDGCWSDAGTHEAIEYLNHYFYCRKHGTTFR